MMPFLMGRHKAPIKKFIIESSFLSSFRPSGQNPFASLWQMASCLTPFFSQGGRPPRRKASHYCRRTIQEPGADIYRQTGTLPAYKAPCSCSCSRLCFLFWRPRWWHRLAGDYKVIAALSGAWICTVSTQQKSHSPLPRLLAAATSFSVPESVRQNEREMHMRYLVNEIGRPAQEYLYINESSVRNGRPSVQDSKAVFGNKRCWQA